MKKKAQDALTYLLLIDGAVLVAAIVIAMITTVPTTIDPGLEVKCANLNTYSGQTCVKKQHF